MIELTGLDQMLECPIQKQVVLLLLRSLLELSLLVAAVKLCQVYGHGFINDAVSCRILF